VGTQQSGHASRPQGLDQSSKTEVVPKMAHREAQIRDSLERSELDPAEDARRRCKKNSPSVLSCIGKRTRDGCDRGSKVETVYSG